MPKILSSLTSAATLSAMLYSGDVYAKKLQSLANEIFEREVKIYPVEEIATISAVCKSNNILLHMDDAQIENAIVSLDVAPANVTWRVGVDILS